MKVIDWIPVEAATDGAGVKILRAADFRGVRLDPFLMIDHLKSDDEDDYIAGFPEHPHRGIETFTYMIKGGFEHKDHMGNKKAITAGHVQWMSTGFGVVHSEMPLASEEGMNGFQIWINMPAEHKLREARYKDSLSGGIPELSLAEGVNVRALAGSWDLAGQVLSSPLNELASDAAIIDLEMEPNTHFSLAPVELERLVLVLYEGAIAQPQMEASKCLVLDSSKGVSIESGQDGARALLLKGTPLREPVAHLGPFVMNTHEQLKEAVRDYQSGLLGKITV